MKKARIQKIFDDAFTFEGFMNKQHILTFLYFLEDQKRRDMSGDLLEFGLYKGRSASVLLNAASKGDKAFFIDSSEHPELDKLNKINSNFVLLKGKSEKLIRENDLSLPDNNIRFSHHDASHTFDNLFTELEFLEKVAAPDPIIVLDDFGSWAYPQVQAAAYGYLYNENTDFEIFLISNTKAYLCRKKFFSYYENFVLNELFPGLKKSGYDYQIARTDLGKLRAFALREKSSATLPDLYGENIWGDKYYRLIDV